MKHYEMIDTYITENHNAYGEEFHRRDVQAWLDEMGWDVDAGVALTAHREAPNKRMFTTERVGMGRHSHYVIVATDNGLTPSAVRRMHAQQAQEMISRWEQEARLRMAPLFKRDRRAKAYFDRAATQMKLVAVTLDQDIQAFLDDVLGDED